MKIQPSRKFPNIILASTFFSGASDIHNYSIEDYHKAVTPLLHSALFFSEEMQINGLSIIYDCAGLNMKHLAWIGKERLRRDAKRHGVSYVYLGSDVIKPVLGAFDKARLKPISSATETRYNREFSLVSSLDMILFNKLITKALIRLRGCAGWSAPLLLANPRRHVFSR